MLCNALLKCRLICVSCFAVDRTMATQQVLLEQALLEQQSRVHDANGKWDSNRRGDPAAGTGWSRRFDGRELSGPSISTPMHSGSRRLSETAATVRSAHVGNSASSGVGTTVSPSLHDIHKGGRSSSDSDDRNVDRRYGRWSTPATALSSFSSSSSSEELHDNAIGGEPRHSPEQWMGRK